MLLLFAIMSLTAHYVLLISARMWLICVAHISDVAHACNHIAHHSSYVVLVLLVLTILMLTVHNADFMLCYNIAHCPGAVVHHLWLVAVIIICCLLFLIMYHPDLLSSCLLLMGHSYAVCCLRVSRGCSSSRVTHMFHIGLLC